MGTARKPAALALALAAAACGGGTGAGNSGAANSSFGVVHLLDHAPAADAVQVPVDTTISLEFDSAMALDSFGDEDTWLRKVGSSQNVPGTFARSGITRVAFTPNAALDLESDYEFQLSALTCDQAGRILDVTVLFGFRTFDATPPRITNIDVQNGSQSESRTRTYTVTFSEPIASSSVSPATFHLRDVSGQKYAASYTVAGNRVTLDPYLDLPGSRQLFLLTKPGITDRAGNPVGAESRTGFRTAVDVVAPSLLSTWPAMNQTGVSPVVQPTFTFDESMDPASVQAASLLFQDQFGSVVPFAIESDPSQRLLRVRPTVTLQTNRGYTMAFMLGSAAATDVSGNPLSATQALAFTTGSDVIAPVVSASSPASGESRVPGSVVADVVFSEALDGARISNDTVSLLVDGEPWTAVVATPTPDSIRVTPVLELPTDAECSVKLQGGQGGLRDLAGNVLADEVVVSFTTSSDAGVPQVLMLPPEGAAGIAPSSRVSFLFDAPMDPSTLNENTLRVLEDTGQPLPGTLAVSGGSRVVAFTPQTPFSPSTYYRLEVKGGSAGARRASGNWFAADQRARWRTGTGADSQAPVVSATVNGIHQSRLPGLIVPNHGFAIDVSASDNTSQWVDMGTVEVIFQGNGSAPGAATLLATSSFGYNFSRVEVPETAALTDGVWNMTVTVRDLSGNVGTSSPVSLTVSTPTGRALPFERTQVVWVRTDLDRIGGGMPDFDGDLRLLGLTTAGDPIGTNTWMRNLVLNGILAKSNHLFGRGSRGEPLDAGSVGLRFTKREPIGLPHMQIALGGLDPEGSRTRVYGDESTGVLGRAYYDYCNGNPSERNISTSPGLGVFCREMWLYQARIHLQVWPSWQTSFAQKFLPLSPDMGGTPAGAHALDSIVLSSSFDYGAATTSQRARWQVVMDAADDWASVMGVILAHEVGHSVGLVAPGPAPQGLYGDSSLHNTFAGATDVMAPSVGYEAMITLDYRFRDIDLAYLRHEVLLR
ncbi:MAG TPA: Ig-like domain-containing protein [Planctomycetota bacterium]|nr:Ig-like domain-containing protein [Planctomycetota bacterium]